MRFPRSAIARGSAILVNTHWRRLDEATTRARSSRARFDNRELDVEGRNFLGDRLDETFNPPFGRAIEADVWLSKLTAF
jgi:hypothetical protein